VGKKLPAIFFWAILARVKKYNNWPLNLPSSQNQRNYTTRNSTHVSLKNSGKPSEVLDRGERKIVIALKIQNPWSY